MADTIWTQADIDTLKAAVVKGVLTVRYAAGGGGPERLVTYQSLAEMRSLLAEMVRAVNGTPTYRLGATRSGLNGTRGNDGGLE